MHICPECGQSCVCRGDIDDIDWGESINCNCCADKFYAPEDDDAYDDYEEIEEEHDQT